MNSSQNSNRQRGFFDLGLSLLVLALAGGFVYSVESSQARPSTAEQQAVETAQTDQSLLANNAAGDYPMQQ